MCVRVVGGVEARPREVALEVVSVVRAVVAPLGAVPLPLLRALLRVVIPAVEVARGVGLLLPHVDERRVGSQRAREEDEQNRFG
eukprot:1189971-Prorocentrum_minimum.AAC.4